MKTKYEVICDGDSWTFGCEIVDPEVKKKYDRPGRYVGEYDFYEENDKYRTQRIWSTYLQEYLDCNTINISWPADDNTTILNRTINYITANYLSKGKSTENLIVIVGWTSPERNSFWYNDGELNWSFRVLPNVRHFDTPYQEEFWKLYVSYLWNREEYIPRFIMTNLQLQNFCRANNIKYVVYNSFYQTANKSVDEWEDLNVNNELSVMKASTFIETGTTENRNVHTLDWYAMWDQISDTNFYKKDQKKNTFNSYIKEHCTNPYTGLHPSPEGHRAWAKELASYLTKVIIPKN